MMTKLIYSILSIFAMSAFCMPASGGTVLFDFNSGPQYAPLPLDLTVQGITAHFSATGQGFSIQDTAQVIGVLPTGFSGLGIVPSSVFPADLLVSFPQEQVTDFSIMVAPQELATDSTATLRVTAYMNGVFVGTNTSMGSEPFLWPSSTLSFSSRKVSTASWCITTRLRPRAETTVRSSLLTICLSRPTVCPSPAASHCWGSAYWALFLASSFATLGQRDTTA